MIKSSQFQFHEIPLVEHPIVEVFESLGWEHIDCRQETLGSESPTGRNNFTEVVLKKHLDPKLREYNPDLSAVAIKNAIRELTESRQTIDRVKANKDVFDMLRDGVDVTFRGEHGERVTENVEVIDWDQPENNHFLVASEMTINSPVVHRNKRPDLVGFVNGLPLVYVNLKRPSVPLRDAYDNNLRDYKDTIPQMFWYNALVILSNGGETRVGSFSAGWDHFGKWNKVLREDEKRETRVEKALRGTCHPKRLLDLVDNFTLYKGVDSGTPEKILVKNHQYLGVNNAFNALRSLKEEEQKLGVFWHTQGSGKSLSMAFFSQKVLRQYGKGYTFLIITDRVDLSDQIYKKAFGDTGLVREDEEEIRAQRDGERSGREHLRQLLQEDHRFVFARIQKFQTEDDEEKYPVLSERNNIIVMTDEAHRSQYDTLAMNMRRSLPNARYLAFTATPLMDEMEKTRQVFGEYVSIYNFRESMEDEATVPLHYENRIPRLNLDRDLLEEGLEQISDDYNLDEDQEDEMVRTFSSEKEILTREQRLEEIAKDIVEHFVGRCFDEDEDFRGKGMVVSIGKFTTVRMYNKVQKYWAEQIEGFKNKRKFVEGEELEQVNEKIRWMEETNMRVVISHEQNEIDDFRQEGLDIVPHRERIENEDLKTKFQDPDDPFRLVFLCAKWLTGFDAPSCSTMYLDKPMKKHTLMQAIARTNRKFRDKQNGLIVDYVGILGYLKKALSVYAEPRRETEKEDVLPVEDKEVLLEELDEKLAKTVSFCKVVGVDLRKILDGHKLEITQGITDAREELVKQEDIKKDFLELARDVRLLYKAVKPDDRIAEKMNLINLIEEISRSIRSLAEPPDISEVEEELQELLDEAVSVDAQDPGKGYGDTYDLSEIDFDRLEQQFEQTEEKYSMLERLRNLMGQKIREMVHKNKSRDYLLERYEEIVEAYNLNSAKAEEYYKELMQLAREMREEEIRPARENMTEEELAVFDILMDNDVKLNQNQKEEVKRVAKDLLESLKDDKLIQDWKSTQDTQARVQTTIKRTLSQLPDSYPRPVRREKRAEVFAHIYDNYEDAQHHVYEMAG